MHHHTLGFFVMFALTLTISHTASFSVINSALAPTLEAIPKTNYPIRLGYIDRLFDYSTVDKLASSFGVPGYSEEKIYNYLSLGFWRCADLPS